MTKKALKEADKSAIYELISIIIFGFGWCYLLAVNCAIFYFLDNDLYCMGSASNAHDL
jgi:hypothetical protein